jgi:hypothetical protein
MNRPRVHPRAEGPTKKETLMAPPSPVRPLNVALVLALGAVILSARLLMGYMHAGAVAPPAPPVASFGEYRELVPLW